MPDARPANASAVSVAERTAELLREEICSGSLAPGEVVREPDLAARFGISRTPVREAIARLEVRGLLVRRNGRIVVSELTRREAAEVYTTRIPLECLAACLAAQTREPAAVRELEGLLALAADGVRRQDWVGTLGAARAFHEGLILASGNTALARTLSHLHDRIDHYRLLRPIQGDRIEASFHEHERILAAVICGDAAEARAAARAHLERARDDLLARVPVSSRERR